LKTEARHFCWKKRDSGFFKFPKNDLNDLTGWNVWNGHRFEVEKREQEKFSQERLCFLTCLLMGDPLPCRSCRLGGPTWIELERILALIFQSVIDLDMTIAYSQASSQRMELGHHRVIWKVLPGKFDKFP
jgi:hypothetical protein